MAKPPSKRGARARRSIAVYPEEYKIREYPEIANDCLIGMEDRIKNQKICITIFIIVHTLVSLPE